MRDRRVVIHASALLDLLVSDDVGTAVWGRLGGRSLHAPGHIDAEVFSALGRLEGAGRLRAEAVRCHAETIAAAPIERHAVADLLAGAWHRRDDMDLDPSAALYIELARMLGTTLVTTDAALAARAAPFVELVGSHGSG